MRNSHFSDLFSGRSTKRLSREDLKKHLRVVQGGKASPPTPLLDEAVLNDDKFLRSHYLERQTTPFFQMPLWEGTPGSNCWDE